MALAARIAVEQAAATGALVGGVDVAGVVEAVVDVDGAVVDVAGVEPHPASTTTSAAPATAMKRGRNDREVTPEG